MESNVQVKSYNDLSVKPKKTSWYMKDWVFWCITLAISITISVLCAKFLVPLCFDKLGTYIVGIPFFKEGIKHEIATFLSAVMEIIKLGAPYVTGVGGVIGSCIFNISTRENSTQTHTLGQYFLSILSTCAFFILTAIAWSIIVLIIFIIIILITIKIVLKVSLWISLIRY